MSSNTSYSVEELPSIFSDLTPIPQQDGPVSVSRIDYSADFITTFDYFRAVLHANERSERAWRLTTLCLTFNPANYTVWHFRRLCLDAMVEFNENASLADFVPGEMELTAKLGGANPKNYQIWYHKRALLEKMRKENKEQGLDFCKSELVYTASVFSEDGKNYHSWSYRQWVVQTVNTKEAWEEELDYADSLIQEDIRNNSAWNQRWFASHKGNQDVALDASKAIVEADYAISKAEIDPYNESPWRYLIAIIKERIKALGEDEAAIEVLLQQYIAKAVATKQVLIDSDKDPEDCPNLTSALIDLLVWRNNPDSIEEAADLCQKMAEEHDPIRKKYWYYRLNQLRPTTASP